MIASVALLVVACKPEGPSGPVTPTAVFDEAWSQFDEVYPFFPSSGVDWHGLRETYRDSVTNSTSDQETGTARRRDDRQAERLSREFDHVEAAITLLGI